MILSEQEFEEVMEKHLCKRGDVNGTRVSEVFRCIQGGDEYALMRLISIRCPILDLPGYDGKVKVMYSGTDLFIDSTDYTYSSDEDDQKMVDAALQFTHTYTTELNSETSMGDLLKYYEDKRKPVSEILDELRILAFNGDFRYTGMVYERPMWLVCEDGKRHPIIGYIDDGQSLWHCITYDWEYAVINTGEY